MCSLKSKYTGSNTSDNRMYDLVEILQTLSLFCCQFSVSTTSPKGLTGLHWSENLLKVNYATLCGTGNKLKTYNNKPSNQRTDFNRWKQKITFIFSFFLDKMTGKLNDRGNIAPVNLKHKSGTDTMSVPQRLK